MPVAVEAPAEVVAKLYRDAELRVLRRVVEFLNDGIGAPDWAQTKLARLQSVRDVVLRELASVDVRAADALADEIAAAYRRGGAEAVADLRGVLAGQVPVVAQQTYAVRALADDIVNGVKSTRLPVLGFVDGVVRESVARAVAGGLTSAAARRAAGQEALDDLLRGGLQGVRLPSGRKMSMVDYVSMATRTGIGNAQREGHTRTQLDAGLNLIAVQPGPRACDICDKWARRILSLDGSSGRLEARDWRTGGTISVSVDGTIEEAIADGLEHPNCRCSRRTFVPGATDPSSLERPPWDADAYEAQQRQRQIERQIRNWKTREATAMSPELEKRARDRVKSYQKKQRELLSANDFLKRQSAREQIGRVL